MIYLDNAATTPVFDEVAEIIYNSLKNDFYNPSSLYLPANKVLKKIETARATIAAYLNVKPAELYFTSCATESNNFAVFNGFKNKKGNIVASAGEHASVYEPLMQLYNKGTDVRFAQLISGGQVDTEKFLDLIDGNTSFVSIIHKSNETGALNDIKNLSLLAKQKNKNLIFHSDGVQAFGKINYKDCLENVDIYSISAHKIGGPKGVGAIVIKNSLKMQPYLFGGGQEKNMRSGTENISGILGFEKAVKLFYEKYDPENISVLNKKIITILTEKIPQIKINTSDISSNIISVSIPCINAEILQRLLCDDGILIGLGSACASKLKTNRVLSQMGIESTYITGSIRLSLGIKNTISEVEYACEKIAYHTNRLKGQSIG